MDVPWKLRRAARLRARTLCSEGAANGTRKADDLAANMLQNLTVVLKGEATSEGSPLIFSPRTSELGQQAANREASVATSLSLTSKKINR